MLVSTCGQARLFEFPPLIRCHAGWLSYGTTAYSFVTGIAEPKTPKIAKPASDTPKRIVIVGGGAAGFAAAEMLRREDFAGSIVMLSNDAAAPVDRPSLSKEYLAGNASDDWVPLRPSSFYSENAIDLRLATDVTRLDPGSREIALSDGQSIPYDRLLLATGAEPIRLWIPGADQAHVHSLRSLADCRAIVARATNGTQGNHSWCKFYRA